MTSSSGSSGSSEALLAPPLRKLSQRLRHEHGVIADAREPDTLRFAPVPLYSTYHDCWRAADALALPFVTLAPAGSDGGDSDDMIFILSD